MQHLLFSPLFTECTTNTNQESAAVFTRGRVRVRKRERGSWVVHVTPTESVKSILEHDRPVKVVR